MTMADDVVCVLLGGKPFLARPIPTIILPAGTVIHAQGFTIDLQRPCPVALVADDQVLLGTSAGCGLLLKIS